ncbi:hypothetical protein [Nocardioides sp. NPDC127503]|uniref:hypothetical protein n=1 Tax=Nocardioides sp. NPDC127503 TaxID=3154516 RepID=UPI00333023B2
MGVNSHEAAWVAELLILLPDVEVLGLRVGNDRMWIGSDSIPIVTLDVHVKTLTDAEALATDLHLSKLDHDDMNPAHANDPERVWHTWQGWAHEGSRQAACWVEVKAAERIPAEDTVAA